MYVWFPSSWNFPGVAVSGSVCGWRRTPPQPGSVVLTVAHAFFFAYPLFFVDLARSSFCTMRRPVMRASPATAQ